MWELSGVTGIRARASSAGHAPNSRSGMSVKIRR